MPHWDEALDESIGRNEAVCSAMYLQEASAPVQVHGKQTHTALFIPIDSSKASSQSGNQFNKKHQNEVLWVLALGYSIRKFTE